MRSRRTLPVSLLALTAAIAGLVAAAPAPAQAPPPPPCAAGTPAAVSIDGLRERVPYGPREVFSVGNAVTRDWGIEGLPTVRMAGAEGGSPAFFEDEVSLDEPLYVQLDLDDRPVAITATFAQRNETAEDNDGTAPPGSTTCLMTVREVVRGYRRVMLPVCFQSRYRPATYIVTCADAGYRLGKLRWRGWNRAKPVASGVAQANDCIPACAGGRFHSYRVRVTAYRIRRCRHDRDRYRYTRLRVHYPGARPAGLPRTDVLRERCQDFGL